MFPTSFRLTSNLPILLFSAIYPTVEPGVIFTSFKDTKKRGSVNYWRLTIFFRWSEESVIRSTVSIFIDMIIFLTVTFMQTDLIRSGLLTFHTSEQDKGFCIFLSSEICMITVSLLTKPEQNKAANL